MKLDLSGKWQIGDGTLIFKIDDKPNTSSAVTGPTDFASLIAAQQIQTGTLSVNSATNYTWKSDGLFLTIYDLSGKVNSQWVLFEKRLVMFNPAGTAITKL